MSKKDLIEFSTIFLIPICFVIFVYLGVNLPDFICKIRRKRILGRHKYNLSVIARFICIICGAVLLCIFNYKLALSCAFFTIFFIIDEKWKNYGK
jgi:hypothetical protein